MRLRQTVEFAEWFDGLSEYFKDLVRDRFDRIRFHDHFGDVKALGGGVFELRWKNGMRVYFGYIADDSGRSALMLLGGDKHGQNHDISKARAVLAREAP